MSGHGLTHGYLQQLVQALPAALRETTVLRLQALELSLDEDLTFLEAGQLLPQLVKAVACSEFIAASIKTDPGALRELVDSGVLLREVPAAEFMQTVARALDGITEENAYLRGLRRLRTRQALRIAWREINTLATPAQTIQELSWFATACLRHCTRYAEQSVESKYGTPLTRGGERQSLMVVAMGKLGGEELNFSSDIDLLFVYPEQGSFKAGRGIDYARYFSLVGQKLIYLLSAVTADGIVFRVDMRLRPYGDSGPLVMSLDALEEYYQSQGREWERYALIKARVLTGDEAHIEAFYDLIRPFVYRRYLDYGVFESLREMKALIGNEVKRKSLQHNIKLGEGGIREVEFTGQAFQLVHGGRDPALQCRGIVRVLALLADRGFLSAQVCQGLTEAYYFLRRVENLLQAMHDQQTHTLPEEKQARARLAIALGYEQWEHLAAELAARRQLIHRHFSELFLLPRQAAETSPAEQPYQAIWQQSVEQPAALEFLQQAGYQQAAEVLRLLDSLRQSRVYSVLSSVARQRVDQIIPLVLQACAQAVHEQHSNIDPLVCLRRVLRLVEAVASRSAYLALLIENPHALQQLTSLFAMSAWIARQILDTPALLDQLLDARSIYTPLGTDTLQQDLQQRLSQVDAQDLEQQMEILRNFKQSSVLHVAAVDIAGVMPLHEISNDLTAIAETILHAVLQIAWDHLVMRHGLPGGCTQPAQVCGFAVIAYGKLGGYELGYGSDLDLVFLYDGSRRGEQTSGDKKIDNAVFYARLAQRIIHLLNAHTPAGILYEVDTRLRPNGASGLLVSDIHVFLDYQQHEAWTWEHQALVRARALTGDPALCSWFVHIRREVLMQQREPDKLRQEVLSMRERMRQQLGSKDPQHFDIKHGRGGITDIEFIVQYLVLRHASECASLLAYTDVLRQLETLVEFKYLGAVDARLLTDAYRVLRSALHRLTLQDLPALAEAGQFLLYRHETERLWRKIMETG